MLRLIRRDVIVLSTMTFSLFSFIPYFIIHTFFVSSDEFYRNEWYDLFVKIDMFPTIFRWFYMIAMQTNLKIDKNKKEKEKIGIFQVKIPHIDIQDKLFWQRQIKYRYLYTYVCMYPNVIRYSKVEIVKVFVLKIEAIAIVYEFHEDFVKRHWKIILSKFSYSQWLWRQWWQQL